MTTDEHKQLLQLVMQFDNAIASGKLHKQQTTGVKLAQYVRALVLFRHAQLVLPAPQQKRLL